jgi:hypothetical protein
LFAASETTGTPGIPEMGSVATGVSGSSLVTENVPVLDAAFDPEGGEKRTVYVTFDPGRMVCGNDGLPTSEKAESPVTATLLTRSFPRPVFWTTTSLVAEVPRATVPKLRSPESAIVPVTPVPVAVSGNGDEGSSDWIWNVAVRLPLTEGWNCIV